MKTLTVLLSLGFVALTGCGSSSEVSASAPAPCNLSALKIKSVKIEGDKQEFVARAIKSALYKNGAKVADKDGVEMVGAVRWGSMAPLNISAEVPSMAFASVGRNSELYAGVGSASEILAQQVVDDFCKCATAAATPKPAQKP